MFAVVKSGGKQYRVQPGQIFEVEKIEGAVGDKIMLDNILLLEDEKNLHIGHPLVKDALVETQIIRHLKDKKVIIFKMKKRKGYHKKQGHRQQLTSLKVIDIHSPIP